MFLQQDSTQAHDQVQGRSQLMADGGKEAALHSIGFLRCLSVLHSLSVEAGSVKRAAQLLHNRPIEIGLFRSEYHVTQLTGMSEQRDQCQLKGVLIIKQALWREFPAS